MLYRKSVCILIFITFVFSLIFFIPDANALTSLSLEPHIIAVPYLELDDASTVVFIKLNIYNVLDLDVYSFKFTYDMNILEPYPPNDNFGLIDPSFYATTGGWRGNSLTGDLSKPFSRSGTMFIYSFRVRNSGTTQVNLTDIVLRHSDGSIIPHTVSGSTIEVLSFEDWVDGEYAELMEKYDALSTNFFSINSTYYNLLSNNTQLQETHVSLNSSHSLLQEDYIELEGNYTQLNEVHASLTSNYNELESEYNIMMSEINNIRNLMYVFITTSIILIITTVYFAKKKQSFIWK